MFASFAIRLFRAPIDATASDGAGADAFEEVFRDEKQPLWQLLVRLAPDRACAESAFTAAFQAVATATPPPTAAPSPLAKAEEEASAAASGYRSKSGRKHLTTALYREALRKVGETSTELASVEREGEPQRGAAASPTSPHSDDEGGQNADALVRTLERALATVPIPDRIAFLLVRLLHLSFADVAEIVSESPECVCARVARAHRALAALLCSHDTAAQRTQ